MVIIVLFYLHLMHIDLTWRQHPSSGQIMAVYIIKKSAFVVFVLFKEKQG